MIIDTMKADRLQYRKARDVENTKFLTVFLGDLENEQLRGIKVNNDFVVRKLKKDIANIREYGKGDELKEADLLEKYLPKQLTEQELDIIIDDIIKREGFTSIGPVMGKLKQLYGNDFDGKLASKLVKQKLA